MTAGLLANMLKILDQEFIPFEREKWADQVFQFLREYQEEPKHLRDPIIQRYESRHEARLTRYGCMLAERAIRCGVPADVLLGLISIALGSSHIDDYRYIIVSMCLLHHSAIKIGADPADLFHQAVEYGNEPAKDFMLRYLAHGEKRIGAMAMEEAMGPNGFEYWCTGNPY